MILHNNVIQLIYNKFVNDEMCWMYRKVTLRKHGINIDIVLVLCITGTFNIIFVPLVCQTQLFPLTLSVGTHIQPGEFLWIPDK